MTTSRSTPRVRFIVLLLLLAVLAVAFSNRAWLAGMGGQVAQWLGLVCVVVAALGRVWTSSFILGLKDSSLVRSGPYAACRHPLYAFSLLAMLGAGLATRSIALAGSMLCLSALAHAAAMRREDAFLAATHGADYEAYRARVPALWPDRSRYSVPERIEVRPRVFWKSFLDAGSLVAAWLLIVVADFLQTHGITPTLFDLP